MNDYSASVTFVYMNHKGQVSHRHVRPIRLWHGSTEWHQEPQLLLRAFDFDRNAERDFAMRDIDKNSQATIKMLLDYQDEPTAP